MSQEDVSATNADLNDPFKRLARELESAGFRIEPSWASSSGPDRDYVHRTHCIYRDNHEVGRAAIVPWERRADLQAGPEVRSVIEPMFKAYKERAFGTPISTEHESYRIERERDEEIAEENAQRLREAQRLLSPNRTCPFCKGHGGWGGLSEPFVRCSHCRGTGKG